MSAEFSSVCRQWRQYRRLSQMELALAADVSQRHLSWLETGKSKPSRDMVIRLSEALDVPLRERNTLLEAAGYAGVYAESDLSREHMAPVLDVVTRMLAHHDPMPAYVVDRFWNVLDRNRSASMLLAFGGDVSRFELHGRLNLALMTLHPEGMRQFLGNWNQVAPHFVRRLEREYLATGDVEVKRTLSGFIKLAGDLPDASFEPLMPVLPMELQFGEVKLSLFSVITTFGTPQDITTEELRIEAFYPTDAATEAFFVNALADVE